jgi:hypothetical protein
MQIPKKVSHTIPAITAHVYKQIASKVLMIIKKDKKIIVNPYKPTT